MEKLTKGNSILYNQLWINKAIEEGNIIFLPTRRPLNISIGEYIEKAYETKPEKEFNKITKRNSLLFEREWREKAREEGIPIPNRRVSTIYSLGEILELKYFERKITESDPNKVLYLRGKNYTRKK